MIHNYNYKISLCPYDNIYIFKLYSFIIYMLKKVILYYKLLIPINNFVS